MKKLLMALMTAVLLLCSTALAEYRPATASPTPPPYGWVDGVVTDAATGAKLSGVTVSADGKTTTTDGQGQYTLQLSLGTQTLTFAKQDYVTANATVTMQAGNHVEKDCALEPEMGSVHGVVDDAVNGDKLSGVTVSVDGKSVVTNANGEYSLQVSPGMKTLTFTRDGYIETYANVNVQRGGNHGQDVSMSKRLENNQYRVVLTWGASPRDLDSHLVGKSSLNKEYHVYYSARNPVNANGEASLDRDDTSGYGPETTTFKVTNNSTYTFYVYDYSNKANSSQLKNSDAKVEVYCGNELLHVFTVPYTNGGWWEVFRIENSGFKVVDQITSIPPVTNGR